MSGRARKRPTFEWHHSAHDAPATVRLRHTDISIDNASGRPSTQSSFITAPASPSKALLRDRLYTDDYLLHQMGPTVEVDDGMGGGGGLGEHLDEGALEDEDELAVDPNYQRHLDELGGAKKKRIQVCACQHHHHFVAPSSVLLRRSIHSAHGLAIARPSYWSSFAETVEGMRVRAAAPVTLLTVWFAASTAMGV